MTLFSKSLLAVVVTVLLTGCATTTIIPDDIEPNFIRNGADSLHYTIDIPSGDYEGPRPAFVLVNGSGEQTKYWNQNISAPLVEQGFIALRYDKRGTGYSSGKLPDVTRSNSMETIALLASDVVAVLDVLMDHPMVDPERVGLVGVSQAGWVIPRAAQMSGEVDWMMLLVGPTVSVGEEAAYSKAASRNEDASVEALSAELDSFDGAKGYDPASDLAELSIPGLWLLGEADRSIPTLQSVRVLQSLSSERDKPFSVRVYPEVGHCLHTCGATIWPDVKEWLSSIGLDD